MSSSVVWLVAICAAVAAAPWFSGGEEPIALLLSGTVALLGGYLLWRQPKVRAFSAGPLLWFYLAYAGWAALSLIWTVNRYSTAIWVVPLLLAGLIFRLVYSIAREEQGRLRVMGLYMVSALIFCAYGLWLYLTGGYERFTGSFYWANPAAAYLIPAMLVSLTMLLFSNGKKWLWAVISMVYGMCFLLTDSRAGLAVLLLTLIIYVAVQRLDRQQWMLLVLTLLGTYVLSTGAVQLRHYVQPRATLVAPGARLAEAAGGSQSSSDRLHYIESAFAIWADHPVVGSGAGTYGDVHPKYQGRVVSASSNAHNYFVQTLSELGLIGGILLGLLLLAIAGVVARGALQQDGNVPLILALGALLVHGGPDLQY